MRETRDDMRGQWRTDDDRDFERRDFERREYGYGQGGYGQGYEAYGGGYGGASWGRGSQSVNRGLGSPDWQERERGWKGSDWREGQEQRGPFGGRGPKGYRRSDERIREDVSDRLTDDQWIDASDIEVKVESGMVTLSGKVKSRDDKRRAEDIAMACSGVRDVINQIHVEQGLLDQIEEAVTGREPARSRR